MMQPKKIVRKLLPTRAISGLEYGYRKSRGAFWRARYGWPARDMRVIAVTGTNGKTTTCSYINAMLKHAGYKTAVYTTAFIEVDGDNQPNKTHLTISHQSVVQKFFAEARSAQVDWVILEVTSHALDQGRIDGTPIEIAAITNLTQEHLDYHGTMDRYAAAKALLLRAPYSPRVCVLNADDEWFTFFADRATGEVMSYGMAPKADIRLTSADLSPHGFSITARYIGTHTAFTSRLVGKFNAYNALAAYGVGVAAGLSQEEIEQGLASLKSVPGRMEQIEAGQPFSVIVDFAITPDALEQVLTALQEVTTGKVAIVFGSTGDRDRTKRGPMGEVVGKLADRIYLTDDETYTEDPETIRQEVYAGIKAARAIKKTKVIDDRREAIRQAFKDAQPGDTVLLTGIGNEDYRNMGGKKEPWDERVVAREELKAL